MLEKSTPAVLILENGMRFEGRAFGYQSLAVGEVVFNTGMSGYQEILTDPSYAGQIVVMTYPLIGNYGANLEDMESDSPKLSGFIVKEKCDIPSNWRCEMNLDGFLQQHKVMGLEGIDTRSLTKVLRDHGIMKGVITVDTDINQESACKEMESYSNHRVVSSVTTKGKYILNGAAEVMGISSVQAGRGNIAVIDLGVKSSILDGLSNQGNKLTVFPAYTAADEILSVNPDVIFLSDGPGSPYDIPEIIETVKILLQEKPVIGVCLGCQVLGLAMGCTAERMKFGHHGNNYPVKSIDTGRVYITSQNHEYVLSSLSQDVYASFINVNDGTIEGIRHRTLPLAGIQFYPEMSQGPNDTGFIIYDFLKSILAG